MLVIFSYIIKYTQLGNTQTLSQSYKKITGCETNINCLSSFLVFYKSIQKSTTLFHVLEDTIVTKVDVYISCNRIPCPFD